MPNAMMLFTVIGYSFLKRAKAAHKRRHKSNEKQGNANNNNK